MFSYTFLPKLLNMSLTASVVIIFVLLLRFLLKKAPKVISYALWGIVLFRLLCPVSIESDFSLFGLLDTPVAESGSFTSRIEYIPNNIVHTEYPNIVLPVPGVSDAINDALPQGEEQLRADPLEAPMAIATYVWMAGILAMGIYAAVSYIQLRRKLITASPLRDNIYLADEITSPFVMGLFRAKIYLPSFMEEQEQSFILMHEQHHIRRFDHIIKALAFAALCIHWFNPLVWLAFVLANKDMEMSCDEAVIRKMGKDIRADYSALLLTLATGRRIIAGAPLAFGEGDTKGRIKNLANWKKPAFWVILAAVIACIVLAVCLLTNPVTSVRNPWVKEYVPGAEGILGDVDKEKFENVSEDFAIGADQYGRAVFKDPQKAFDTFVVLYAEGIALIQEQNDLPPISNGNYSAYKTFGWQTTSGPEEAQEQAAFVTKFLDIYENSFTKEIPAENTGIPTTEPAPLATKWFDYLDTPDEMKWDGRLEINLPEFPDVTFRWYPEKIEAVTEKEIVPLYYGTPIWNTYFCDLTGDGLPELCSTYTYGSGIVDSRIIVYDYANGVSYEMNDRGYHDFSLRLGILLNEGTGSLYADKRVYPYGELVSSGRLIFKDHGIQIENPVVGTDESSVGSVVMTPTPANMHGAFDRYLYLPLDGETYRYEWIDMDTANITTDKLLDRFTETAEPENVDWEVYSIKEYPDHSVVLAVAGTDYECLYQYSPSKRSAPTALQQAKEDGCVITENGDVTSGQEIWQDFVEAAEDGRSVSVQVAHYHTLDPKNCSEQYYEAYQEDYPVLYVFNLAYDDGSYTLRWNEGGREYVRTYKYLMRHTGEAPTTNATYDTYIRYVLTNDNTVTWEDLFQGMVSSQFGDYIDHYPIYTDLM